MGIPHLGFVDGHCPSWLDGVLPPLQFERELIVFGDERSARDHNNAASTSPSQKLHLDGVWEQLLNHHARAISDALRWRQIANGHDGHANLEAERVWWEASRVLRGLEGAHVQRVCWKWWWDGFV